MDIPPIVDITARFLFPNLFEDWESADFGYYDQSEQAARIDEALDILCRGIGAITVILGTRGTGKSVLAYRLAERLNRPTFAVSPEQRPPSWVHWIKADDVANPEIVHPWSTLVCDDLPAYASNVDYNTQVAQMLNRLNPLVRHKRKLQLIYCSQSAAQATKYILDCDMAFFKNLGLLKEDYERPFIRRLYTKYVDPYFEGKKDYFIHRHAVMWSRTYKGLIDVCKPAG